LEQGLRIFPELNLNTFHISFFGLAFVGGIFTGLTVSLQLWFARGGWCRANRFLAAAVGVVVLQTIQMLGVDIGVETTLALGPLFYFYVLIRTKPECQFRLIDGVHVIPLLIQWMVQFTSLGKWNDLIQGAAFISVLIYLYACQRLIESYYRLQHVQRGDRYRYQLRWLQRLFNNISWCLVLWAAFYSVDHFGFHDRFGVAVNDTMYLLSMAMIFRLAIICLLRVERAAPFPLAPPYRPLPSDALRQKAIWLNKLINDNRYYEDEHLSLPALAEKLGLSTHELSRIINQAMGKSFTDLINEYRVADVLRKMHDPRFSHMSLLGIAFDAGFNSNSSFHRIFKRVTGKSPAAYKAGNKKDIPSYNLGQGLHIATLHSPRKISLEWSPGKIKRRNMFRNYLKIAWRNLQLNKSYAAINITGLAIGIASCLLILLIVQFETSFDNFHPKGKSIYRVVSAFDGPGGPQLNSGIPFPTSEGLRTDFPELPEVAAVIKKNFNFSVSGAPGKPGRKKFKEEDAYYSEHQFFDMFEFGWLAGDKKTALKEPNTAVLTEDEANKFFGDWHDALGKTIRLNNKEDYTVTGILKNFPDNTDFPTKIVMSFSTLRQKNSPFADNMQDWVSTYGGHNVFIILPPGISESQFDKNLVAFVKKHKPADHVKDGMVLQPLSDMHYNSRVGIYSRHPFSKELIRAISLIGLFLLLIACVNFINLATAQAVNRSKEVGIRKVLGSNRRQLVLQFLSETFIITLLAVMIAILIAVGVIQGLNQLLSLKLSAAVLYQPSKIAILCGATIGVTLLSGFYPAIVLSGFDPISALKNRNTADKKSGISLRRSLVVLQFSIAQVLVIGTFVIVSQMDFFKNRSLGFDKDTIMNVPFPNDSTNMVKLPALRDRLLQLPGVKDVSFSFSSPSDKGAWSSGFKYNNSPKESDFEADLKWADAEFFKLYQLEFVAGEPYKKSDTITGYVVNETLLSKLGIRDPKDAIGKSIGMWDDHTMSARITGVVKDFNVSSLRKAIPPVLMGSRKDLFQLINLKIQPQNFRNTLAAVQQIWSSTFPDGIYEYQFLDEKIADFYKSEDQLSMLYKIFAGIAIFISCLGLYGLVSFMAVQRTKEVGIRKTLGASVSQILYLFLKEFTLLILIAFAISAPVGYYFMHQWLQDFAYKISIGPGIYIMSIIASIAIAWVTVGYKALKAALANPVKSLRSE
jgi:putative ABC transport system permease protein